MSGVHPDCWLQQGREASPDAPMLRYGTELMSYRQMQERVAALAEPLSACRRSGEVLVLRCDSAGQAAFGICVGLQLGVPLLLLDAGLSDKAQGELCRMVGRRRLYRAQTDGFCLLQRKDGPGRHAQAADCRLLVPTSGSTGDPKAVMLSGANIRAAVTASRARIGLSAGDAWLGCLSMFHVGGMFTLFRCLQAGATLVLHERFDARQVWRDLEAAAISHVSLVPAMLYRLLQVAAGRPPPATLRVALVGGAALDPQLAQQARDAGWPLCVTYGMSETASQVATQCAESNQAGCVGVPLDGFNVRISDPDPDGNGRIQLRGPALMTGYATPGLAPGVGLTDGWLLTGDLGRITADGRLCVLGRTDDIWLSGGHKVHPAPLERVLRACPGVSDAVLSAVDDPVWGHRLVAVYAGSAAEVCVADWCQARLSGAELPRSFLRLPRLPYGASGKVDRKRIRHMLMAASG